jgi:hypothetical protein
MCKKGAYMSTRDNKQCKNWRKQDCTNCQHMSKDSTAYYYTTAQKLWYIQKGNPLTGENCVDCKLKDYSLIRQLIDRIKMDASDLFETIGCLEPGVVAMNPDMQLILESICESLGSNTSKAGILGIRARDIERAQCNPKSTQGSLGNIIMVQKEVAVKNNYNV